jgi:hypothetical protein
MGEQICWGEAPERPYDKAGGVDDLLPGCVDRPESAGQFGSLAPTSLHLIFAVCYLLFPAAL